jgi:hypothetical protein
LNCLNTLFGINFIFFQIFSFTESL